VSRNIARTVLVDILIPIAAYLGLVRLGMAPVWALAASAGVSVLVLGLGWWRTRSLSTLGVLVLVRFLLGIVVAVVTGDARFVLVKDYLVTLLIAIAAAATLSLQRPFIARVRRDLSPDPVRFDQQWAANAEFRSVHRQLTKIWVVGLVAEVVVAIAVIYTAPLTVAVIVTNVLTPAVLLTLIAVTQARAGRAERDPEGVAGGAAAQAVWQGPPARE
jgi:hypothetical protein